MPDPARRGRQSGVQHASLAKAFSTAKMRETTGWARELLAGYEGTREINSRIVGLAITGESAFAGPLGSSAR